MVQILIGGIRLDMMRTGCFPEVPHQAVLS